MRLLCISINLPYGPCMEYCCHVWVGAPSCYLELLDKLQKRLLRTFVSSLAASLEPLAHCQNVAGLSLLVFSIGITFVDVLQNWLHWFHFLFLEGFLLVILIRLHDFSVTIPRCYENVYVNSFFPCTARLWNSLPIECLPLN